MPSFKLSNPFRRADGRPSLKARAATLKSKLVRLAPRSTADASQDRRSIVAGSLAFMMPLPVLAAPAPVAPHPDQRLLDLASELVRAAQVEAAAIEADLGARKVVLGVLRECPVELRPTLWEFDSVSGPFKPVWGKWLRLRYAPARLAEDETDCVKTQAWTGKALREVIALAVPCLGQGGQTPHRVRRWKSLLPIADAFDARVAEVEAATNSAELGVARDAATAAVKALTKDISRLTATTPEGMAGLVRVIGAYCWKDTSGAWQNLLISAAHVSGVPLADLGHERASTRAKRA